VSEGESVPSRPILQSPVEAISTFGSPPCCVVVYHGCGREQCGLLRIVFSGSAILVRLQSLPDDAIEILNRFRSPRSTVVSARDSNRPAARCKMDADPIHKDRRLAFSRA
jgi:hypothetical protein